MRRARLAFARAALALVATGVFSLAAGPSAQAAENPLSIAVKVGYSGFVKTQQWMPVTIDVTNKGADVDGTLEVNTAVTPNGQWGPNGPTSSAIYETHVSLPSGATKHLKTYLVLQQTPSPVSVRLVQNGRVVASVDSQTEKTATALIGVLSDRSTAFYAFETPHPGGLRANVVHLSLEDFGDSAILLRAFDLLAIDDFATDTLTAAQRSAITDYVQNGGALLLGTGASWRKTLAGLSPAILPMRIESNTTLNPGGALDKLAGLEVGTGAVNSDARAWLSDGGTPLMAERSVGSGTVTLATFDWAQEPVATWSGTGIEGNPLVRQTIVRTLLASGTPSNMPMGRFGGSGGITGRSNMLSAALGSLPALDLPSLLVIGILVLAYVLLVGPINYFALRALHRRALAWVTVPLIAIVASAGAFGTGLFTKGRSVQTNQVSIVHLQPGWDRAYEESYTGLLTPTRGDYRINVVGARPYVGPISSFNGGMVSANTDLIRVSVDNNSIDLPGMTAFVLRGFATEGVIDAPHLVGSAKLVNGKLTGTIRNDSNVRFTDAVVLAGDGYQILPALAPGATATFSVTPKVSNQFGGGGPPAYLTIYNPNYGSGMSFNGAPSNQSSDANREAMEKTTILSVIAGGGYYGYNPTIAPMVVAWTKQPYEHIAVAGSQPRSMAETAVVLPLIMDEIGSGPLPAGLVVNRLTDIEGTTQPGPPGGVVIQSGAVTYELTPKLAPGTHLTGAALDSSNQIPKGMPPGGSQSLQAQVWDWSQSSWLPLNYTSLGTSALPPATINPSSGEVRLHFVVSGTTPILLGTISLIGTVN